MLLLFLGLGISVPDASAEVESGLEKSDRNIPSPDVLGNSIGMSFENDMFNKMDWYFSNGLNFSMTHSVFEGSPVNYVLFPVRLRERDRAVYGLRLTQEIYTPKDITENEIQEGDHPYAATLSLTEEKIINRPAEGLRFTSGLQIGVIGPAALGFNAQEFIHNNTPSHPPQGWHNQVGNDILLNYYLSAEKEVIRDEVSQLALYVRARLGTVYTDAVVGLWSRFEFLPKFFTHVGPDLSRKVNFHFRLGWELRFVGYDASLQGGMFNRTSPYTIPSSDVSRIVFRASASAVLEIYRHEISFFQKVMSPRFEASDWHGWMGISYRYWW